MNDVFDQTHLITLDLAGLLTATPDLFGRGAMFSLGKHQLIRIGVSLADLLVNTNRFEEPDYQDRDVLMDAIGYVIADHMAGVDEDFEEPTQEQYDALAGDLMIQAMMIRSRLPDNTTEIQYYQCETRANALTVTFRLRPTGPM